MKRFIPIILATMAISAVNVISADWPQWQGPDRTAHSKERVRPPNPVGTRHSRFARNKHMLVTLQCRFRCHRAR